MTEKSATLPEPEMPKSIPDIGAEHPKKEGEMTYLENNNIDEDICQKLRKNDRYETDMQKIYNLIMGQTNKQLQVKAASHANLQAVKSGRYPIGYLMILNKIFFSNQY